MSQTPDIHSTHKAASATEAPALAIDVAVTLWPTICPDCAMRFLLPVDFYARQVESGGRLYCPAGHLIELKAGGAENLDMLAANAHLVGELLKVRVERDTLRNELARRPRPAEEPIDDAELERRMKYLANRSSRTNFGRLICRFCESTPGKPASMRRHLKQYHTEEVRQLPIEFFDSP